jgi:tRNA nucleotidyltransferase (CCA-adding enzyme)
VGKPAVFSLDTHGVGHFYGHPKESAKLAQQALLRLRLDRAIRERAELLVSRHDLPVEPNRAWVGRWLSRLGEDAFFQLLALKRADALSCVPDDGSGLARLDEAERLAREILSAAPCLTLRDLAVDGHDALAAGLSGPEIGTALRALLSQVAEGTLPNDRSVLLSCLSGHS